MLKIFFLLVELHNLYIFFSYTYVGSLIPWKIGVHMHNMQIVLLETDIGLLSAFVRIRYWRYRHIFKRPVHTKNSICTNNYSFVTCHFKCSNYLKSYGFWLAVAFLLFISWKNKKVLKVIPVILFLCVVIVLVVLFYCFILGLNRP